MSLLRWNQEAVNIFSGSAAGMGSVPSKCEGLESMLVAVIPCNDQRLRPRHTASRKKHCVFLFPRSVLLSPVAVKSSFVYFTEAEVQINIKNVMNITNNNFVGVQAYNLTVQALNFDMVVGRVSIKNVTPVKHHEKCSNEYCYVGMEMIGSCALLQYSFVIPIKLTDPDLRQSHMKLFALQELKNVQIVI
ncbi:hypothetical protein NQZ68_016807 [Dissostichus eleginoides]|nr:hypothetical protein NQZ68_016807 [Dissostichus eleginoides]